MARPRSFDYEEVLEAAMAAFWARGYEATSVTDLMCATGLQKGSLYKAFGDKHSLYLETLDHYLATNLDEMKSALDSAASPPEALRAMATRKLQPTEPGETCGCFAVNSVVELAPHDPRVREILMDYFLKKLALVAQAIVAGQQQGYFRTDRDPERLASTFLTASFGMMVAMKGGLPAEEAQANVDTLIALLS